MKKPILYIIVGVVVVVIIALLAMRGGSDTSSETTTSTGGSSDGSSMSLKELFAAGGSQECEFNSDEGGVRSSGLVFVSGNRMRGDFTSEIGGKAETSHMIVDGGTSYVWTDGSSQGVKMSFANVSAQSSQQGSVDADKKVDYSCTSWSADASKFSVPSTVTFADLGAMMGGAGAGAAAGVGAQ